jgi:hypothetical protein
MSRKTRVEGPDFERLREEREWLKYMKEDIAQIKAQAVEIALLRTELRKHAIELGYAGKSWCKICDSRWRVHIGESHQAYCPLARGWCGHESSGHCSNGDGR